MQNNIKCIIFWDYDTQWGADHSRSSKNGEQWGYLEFENTERLLELHARFDIKACFAVVGAAALAGDRPYHDPLQIRRMHSAGHEIASHGLYHEWIPGLTRHQLVENASASKEVLEQCIGASVTTFVPPYNQPFAYPQKLAPAFSECVEAGREHITLPTLCEVLESIGYRFARVSYYPIHQYLLLRLFRLSFRKPSLVERISNLSCVRLNAPVGFAKPTLNFLEKCVEFYGQGVIVFWGHPHSLHTGNSQDECYLIPFLRQLSELRSQGKLQILLPSDLLLEESR